MSQSNSSIRNSDNHTTERGVPVTRIRIDDLPVAENLTPEQEELIQGAGLKSFRPSFEALECREVPAGFDISGAALPAGLDLTGGTLTIQAGASSTRSAWKDYGANVSLDGANQVVVQRIRAGSVSEPVFLDRSQVSNIVFDGGLGKDTFTNNTGIESSARGLQSVEGDTHVRFSMTGPSVLPDESASGDSAVNGQRVGSNIAPDLTWNNLPAGTATLDLSMVDISAPRDRFPDGRFTHMELSKIPPSVRGLREALADPRTVKGEGYYGPNPTNGLKHTYVFTLTARDATGRVVGETQFRSDFQYDPLGVRTDYDPPSTTPPST
jgi:phosphatidylethanolamine-binding protein (PEBP) family uncharacterized protein